MLDLLIDGQCLQSDSRSRGIGRYTRSLLRAVCDARPDWRIRVVQAANLRPIPDADLCGKPVLTFTPPRPVRPFDLPSGRLNGLYFADWLAALRPDALLLPSVVGENQTVSPLFGSDRTVRVVGVSYDFIPMVFPERFFHAPHVTNWYHNRVQHLLAADAILSISQASADDLHRIYPHWRGRSVVVYGGADGHFAPPTAADADRLRAVAARHSLKPDFLLCIASSTDPHKNVSGAIRGYAALPRRVREQHPLVVAGHLYGGQTDMRKVAAEGGVQDTTLFVGKVSESELVGLYQQCRLFLCPSVYEGLGLPVLEAMQCGAPVVTSTRSSLPEVAGTANWLCDVESPPEFASTILAALAEPRDERRDKRLAHARGFSWPRTGEAACRTIEELTVLARPRVAWFTPPADVLAKHPAADVPAVWDALDAHADVELVVEDAAAAARWPTRKTIPAADYRAGPAAYDLVVYTLSDDDEAAFQLSDVAGTAGVFVLLTSRLDRLALRGLLAKPDLYGRPLGEPSDGLALLRPSALSVVDLSADGLPAASDAFRPTAADARGRARQVCDRLAADVAERVASDAVWVRRTTAALAESYGHAGDQVLARWADLRTRRSEDKPPAAPKGGPRRVWVDVGALFLYAGPFSGITRTVASLTQSLARAAKGAIGYFRYCYDERRFVGVSAADVLTRLNGYGSGKGGERLRPAAQSFAPQRDDLAFFPGLDLEYAHAAAGVWGSLGCRVAFVLHDLLPVKFPQWFVGTGAGKLYGHWLGGAIQATDLVVCNSHSTRRDLFQFADQCGLTAPPSVVARFGSHDLTAVPPVTPAFAPGLEIDGRPNFVLLVSTIEVRKNHLLVYQAWRRLLTKHGRDVIPKLAFAGGIGWMSSDMLTQAVHDPITAGHIALLHGTSDAELAWLYRTCQFTLYPSHYEGWGLPVAEGLAFGKMCLASDTSSIPEIAGELVDYHDPQDLAAYVALLERAIFDTEYRAERERQIAARYRLTRWDDTAAQLVAAFDTHFGPVDPVVAAEPPADVRTPRPAVSAA